MGQRSAKIWGFLCFESHIIKCLVFLWAAGLRGMSDFGGTLAQIGLMYLLILFLYCISKDYIKSWGVPDRQFLEYNYKRSYKKYHDNQSLE